jgi:ribosome recycling factor
LAAPPDLNGIKTDLSRRMDGALETLKRDFAGLRTGRASPALLDPVKVESYGSLVPLNQVGSVNVPEPRLMTVKVYEKGMVGAVEKAIRDAGLGLNPAADGQMVRVPIPQLTTERRNELAKAAAKYAENAKVAVRGVRRDGMEQFKALEKKGAISQDELKRWEKEVEALTAAHVKKIDEQLADKDKDIRAV